MLDIFIVTGIILAALLYLALRLRKKMRALRDKKAAPGCSCNCNCSPLKKKD